MKKVIILKGLPASGKTTWAKEQLKKYPGKYKRINKDDLRAMLDGGRWSKSNEDFILGIRDDVIIAAIGLGKHVIIDDTNFHPKHEININKLVKFLQDSGEEVRVEIKEFPIDPQEAIRRDLQRPNSVGSKVIMDMYNKYIKPQPEAYVPPEGKPKAIIVDIDGTIALMNGKRGPFDWDKVYDDDVNIPVWTIIKPYLDRNEVIFVSGRDGSCYAKTKEWLEHFIVFRKPDPAKLFLRPEGDTRKDYIIKKETFDNHIRDNYEVLFVLDDRDQTVDMWRSLGLTCLQVAEGDF